MTPIETHQRDDENAERTFGVLTTASGHVYQILEPGVGPKRKPAGTFEVQIDWSPKHGYPVPWFRDVPGHQAEEIHVGNDEDDTDGCDLTGLSRGVDDRGKDAVLQSLFAFERYMTEHGCGAYRTLDTIQKFRAWQRDNPDSAAPFVMVVRDVQV